MMRPIPIDTVTRCGAIMTIAADTRDLADVERFQSLAQLFRRGGVDQLRPMRVILSRCYFQVEESVGSGGFRCITPSG
jgi:hypothetical protein